MSLSSMCPPRLLSGGLVGVNLAGVGRSAYATSASAKAATTAGTYQSSSIAAQLQAEPRIHDLDLLALRRRRLGETGRKAARHLNRPAGSQVDLHPVAVGKMAGRDSPHGVQTALAHDTRGGNLCIADNILKFTHVGLSTPEAVPEDGWSCAT